MNDQREEQHIEPKHEEQNLEATQQPLAHSLHKKLPNIYTPTMKLVRDLLYKHEEKIDYIQIQAVQQEVLLSLTIQYAISVALLNFIAFMGWGKYVDDIPSIVQVIIFVIFMICMILAQFGGEDYQGPPNNIDLCLVELSCKTIFFTIINFKFPILKFRVFVFIVTLDFLIIFLFFKWDQRNNIGNVFKLGDNKWRIFFTFVLEEVSMNLIVGVTSQQEVYVWFFVFFLIYVFILLHMQLYVYREFMWNYYNSIYLSAVLLESDIIFPFYMVAKHWHCCDIHQRNFAIV